MPSHMIRDLMRRGPKVNVAKGAPLSDEIEAAPKGVKGMLGAGENEGHGSPYELFENALDDLEQLAVLVPEVQVLVARLEALRSKVEAVDEGAGEELAPEPRGGPGPAEKLV